MESPKADPRLLTPRTELRFPLPLSPHNKTKLSSSLGTPVRTPKGRAGYSSPLVPQTSALRICTGLLLFAPHTKTGQFLFFLHQLHVHYKLPRTPTEVLTRESKGSSLCRCAQHPCPARTNDQPMWSGARGSTTWINLCLFLDSLSSKAQSRYRWADWSLI